VKLQTDFLFLNIYPDMSNQVESLEVDDLHAGDFDSTGANLQAGEKGIMWRAQLQLEF
jgi:hypothetical protein